MCCGACFAENLNMSCKPFESLRSGRVRKMRGLNEKRFASQDEMGKNSCGLVVVLASIKV